MKTIFFKCNPVDMQIICECSLVCYSREFRLLKHEEQRNTVFISAPCGNTLLQLSKQAQNNIRHHECPSTETFQQLSFNEKHNDKPKEKRFTEKQFTTQKGQWNKERKKKLQRNVTGPRKSHKMVSDECIFVRLWQHSPWGGNRRGVWRDGAEVTHFTQAFHSMTTEGGCNPENLF